MAMVEHHDAQGDPPFRRFRYDATGLRGKRLRLLTDMPTSDSGNPQDSLIGITDVIAIDDTPGVFLDLRVHSLGDPARTGLVRFDQLALYGD